MTSLILRFFGFPQIWVDETPIKVKRRKTLALLAYLAVHDPDELTGIRGQERGFRTGRGREALAALLWPECSQEQAGAYLRQALWDISKAAGEAWIIKGSQTIDLNPEMDIWVDVNAFGAGMAEWQSGKLEPCAAIALLEDTIALYRGDFLSGFTLRNSPAFDEWQLLQTERLRLRLSHALEALARLYAAQGDIESALAHARRWLELDPLQEAAHRLLMRLYEQNGQRNSALRQYEACQRALAEELGIQPEAETTALYRQIRDGRLTQEKPVRAEIRETPQPVEKREFGKPSGAVTFLFTDIEGSTRLWERLPQAMPQAFGRQEAIIRKAMAEHGGYVYKMIGDAFQVAFAAAPAALEAALDAQRALQAEPWGETGPLKVRMALHTGFTEERGDDYVGPELNRVARILSAGHGGQVLISRSTYELVRGHLPSGVSLQDMGEHLLKDLLHPEHLYQMIAPGLEKDFPPLRTSEPRPNLPMQTTPFVGRESELKQLEALLKDPACRLITLVGIGGSGKTRLAIQTAGQSLSLVSRVAFVGLSAISSREDLISAIAEAVQCSFRATPGVNILLQEAQDQLARFLADQKALLILDNFEQLSSEADLLAGLLSAAPGLKLLVTSRERLNLAGEWILEIDGLPFPGKAEGAGIPDYAAVQCFVHCARRTGHWAASAQDWPAIARICQLLEGLPLGIEMAAAWTKMLSCAEIAAEIERDVDFLSADWRGMPERHRTLRAVFDYSWHLLSNPERQAFCRLGVFQGGFTREAALEIASAPLPLLAALVDKSLVRRVSSGRFDIHPVLKQYLDAKLAELGDLHSEARWKHARYYCNWLARTGEKLKGREQLAALAALRAETPNLRAALRVLVEQQDFARLEEVFPALIHFYVINDQRVETQFMVSLLEAIHPLLRELGDREPGASYPGLLALSLAAYRHFTIDLNHPERSYSYQQESQRLVERLPDSQAKAFVFLLNANGPGLSPEQAIQVCRQCVAIFKQLGDPWGEAMALLILADTANFNQADIDPARQAYQASLEIFSEVGNDWGQAVCNTGLSALEKKAGHLEAAYRYGCQGVEILTRLENYERLIWVRHQLGEFAIALGMPDQARHWFQENLAYFTRTGNERAQAYYRELLGTLG